MINAYVDNTLLFNETLCNNCLMCIHVCPHAVFERDKRKVKLATPANCMECGACQLNCPTGALSVDSGVGCAAAMIKAALTGKNEKACCC
jgi:NAD-dependent dihydropyrimidine dehydrogenase PreA subunit